MVVAVAIEIAVDSFRVRVDQVSTYDYAKINKRHSVLRGLY